MCRVAIQAFSLLPCANLSLCPCICDPLSTCFDLVTYLTPCPMRRFVPLPYLTSWHSLQSSTIACVMSGTYPSPSFHRRSNTRRVYAGVFSFRFRSMRTDLFANYWYSHSRHQGLNLNPNSNHNPGRMPTSSPVPSYHCIPAITCTYRLTASRESLLNQECQDAPRQ